MKLKKNTLSFINLNINSFEAAYIIYSWSCYWNRSIRNFVWKSTWSSKIAKVTRAAFSTNWLLFFFSVFFKFVMICQQINNFEKYLLLQRFIAGSGFEEDNEGNIFVVRFKVWKIWSTSQCKAEKQHRCV